MPTMKSSGDLITSISADMADNNAGLISAEDVRHNMEDIAYSINHIVSSGDTETTFPFHNNVTIKKNTTANEKGILFVESGIRWPNAPNNDSELQTEPFLGLGNISHNDLGDLTVGDTHTQYASISGVKAGLARAKFTGNQAFNSDHWLNASGYDNAGFRFNPTSADGLTQDIMTSGSLVFDDNSRISNGKGVAKAWAYFDASGVGNVPAIRSWYNIDSIARKAAGKLKITFTSGTFENNDYVAIGQANASTSSSSVEDFGVNTVGMVARSGDDGTMLRSTTFAIQDEAGQYVDSELCYFVAYGYSPSESSGTPPTMINETSSPTF